MFSRHFQPFFYIFSIILAGMVKFNGFFFSNELSGYWCTVGIDGVLENLLLQVVVPRIRASCLCPPFFFLVVKTGACIFI